MLLTAVKLLAYLSVLTGVTVKIFLTVVLDILTLTALHIGICCVTARATRKL